MFFLLLATLRAEDKDLDSLLAEIRQARREVQGLINILKSQTNSQRYLDENFDIHLASRIPPSDDSRGYTLNSRYFEKSIRARDVINSKTVARFLNSEANEDRFVAANSVVKPKVRPKYYTCLKDDQNSKQDLEAVYEPQLRIF